MCMIQFKQVSKKYQGNDFHIDDLNFVVDPGEFLFLIGPSGSGKTTVIKMLTREELPTEGQIYFDDFDITRLSRDSVYKLRRQIGVVFQDYKLIPDKTVAENVAFAMEVAGKKDKEIKETVPYLLDIVGLSHRARSFPDFLSGGEKQRVAIARAVSNNPRVLIADEPTGNLDPASAWDIVQILSKINNWGTTVIMSTHGTDIVNTLNKRVIQMQDGRITRDDKHGLYEKSDFTKEQLEEIEHKKEEIRKGPIKVSLRKQKDQQSAVAEEPKKRGFSIWPFHRKKEAFAEMYDDYEEEKDEAAATENNQSDGGTPDPIHIEADDLLRIMADADNISIEKLDISENLAERLEAAGYEDIEDIITAGPEELFNQQIVDLEDVKIISKAVEKFVRQEEEEFEAEEESVEESEQEAEPAEKAVEEKQKPKEKAKKAKKNTNKSKPTATEEDKPKSRAVKIKLDLTGKK